MMTKRIVCVLAMLMASPTVARAGTCDEHADKLLAAQKKLEDLLHKYRGPNIANVFDCFLIRGEIGTIDDEMEFLGRHSCWPSEQLRMRLENHALEMHNEAMAAFHRLGCTEK